MARIEDMPEVERAHLLSIGKLRHGYESIDDVREVPGAIHPIVKRHSETGRENLFLGRRDYAYVIGLPVEESEALLDELWGYAALPQNVWTQHWQVGDVILWDNRRVLHRRDAFDADARRLLKRCQVLAREPRARPGSQVVSQHPAKSLKTRPRECGPERGGEDRVSLKLGRDGDRDRCATLAGRWLCHEWMYRDRLERPL